MNTIESSRRWTFAKLSNIFMVIGMIFTRSAAFAPSIPFSSPGPKSEALCNSRFYSTIQSSSTLEVSSSSLMESTPKSFEERMRDLVMGGRTTTAKPTGSSDSKLPKNVKVVKTLDEYKKVVGDERDRIVVVRFFAPWCKVRWLSPCISSSKRAKQKKNFTSSSTSELQLQVTFGLSRMPRSKLKHFSTPSTQALTHTFPFVVQNLRPAKRLLPFFTGWQTAPPVFSLSKYQFQIAMPIYTKDCKSHPCRTDTFTTPVVVWLKK